MLSIYTTDNCMVDLMQCWKFMTHIFIFFLKKTTSSQNVTRVCKYADDLSKFWFVFR